MQQFFKYVLEKMVVAFNNLNVIMFVCGERGIVVNYCNIMFNSMVKKFQK